MFPAINPQWAEAKAEDNGKLCTMVTYGTVCKELSFSYIWSEKLNGRWKSQLLSPSWLDYPGLRLLPLSRLAFVDTIAAQLGSLAALSSLDFLFEPHQLSVEHAAG
jgi:hypothetical protein